MTESTTKVTELTMDNIDYIVRFRIDFIPGKRAIDPTEQTESEITGHEILNVDAWNNDADFGYTVSDPDELEKIENEIDFEDEFTKP